MRASMGCGVDGGNGFRGITEAQNVSTLHCLLEVPARLTATPSVLKSQLPWTFASPSQASMRSCLFVLYLLQSRFPKTVDPSSPRKSSASTGCGDAASRP